ncbi:MAG: acyl-CoA desaturase [Planctomycetota bacterium]
MTTTRSSFGALQRPPAQFFRNLVYLGFHGSALCVIWAGISWQAVALCVGMYYLRMFGITAGYHRLFSHKTYKTSRPVQFVMALLGTLALQKGVLWWAAHHRNHHTHSDTERDVHSPKLGFWWSHMMWVADKSSDETHFEKVPDLMKYPELVWLNRLYLPIFVGMCVAFHFLLGFQAMVWGCFISTILLWHGTFTINSLSHMIGKRVYATTDTSRNNFVLALLTMGEGWHNNHHFYQAAAHQGFRWWEIDASYYAIVAMEKLGLVWGVKRAPQSVIEGKLGGKDFLIANGAFDVGMLAPEWDPNRPAAAVEEREPEAAREPALA